MNVFDLSGNVGLLLGLFGVDLSSRIGGSIHFFVYDTVKIAILLSTMVFVISYIRSYFSVEKTKAVLERVGGIKAHVLASLLGVVTPFCSCSSIPLFIGFIEGGVPLGVTFSFLITSPIVNEAVIVILMGTFGIKVALLYMTSGIILGVLGGYLIHLLKLERYVEEYVYGVKVGSSKELRMDAKSRFNFAKKNTVDIVSRVWVYLLIGIGVGAVIHGYAPQDILTKYASGNNPLAVIFATIVSIPLYSNAIGTVPIAESLISKGVGVGTALAFMMGTTALSFPEMILLKRVIKPKLISIFVGIVGVGIIIIGCLFNVIT